MVKERHNHFGNSFLSLLLKVSELLWLKIVLSFIYLREETMKVYDADCCDVVVEVGLPLTKVVFEPQ